MDKIKLAEVLALTRKEVPEYCEDYQSWGNMGDAYSHGYERADAIGYNECVCELSKFEIDTLALAQMIFSNLKTTNWELEGKIVQSIYVNMAKHLASNASKWIVKKGKI